jgi:hypothetical protein
MDTCKLRLKLGENELEAEGPQEYVEKEREIFLARLDTNKILEQIPGKPKTWDEREQPTVDLGNGNSVVASSSNLHAAWKI